MSEENYFFLLNPYNFSKPENYSFLLLKGKTFKRKKTVRIKVAKNAGAFLSRCSELFV